MQLTRAPLATLHSYAKQRVSVNGFARTRSRTAFEDREGICDCGIQGHQPGRSNAHLPHGRGNSHFTLELPGNGLRVRCDRVRRQRRVHREWLEGKPNGQVAWCGGPLPRPLTSATSQARNSSGWLRKTEGSRGRNCGNCQGPWPCRVGRRGSPMSPPSRCRRVCRSTTRTSAAVSLRP